MLESPDTLQITVSEHLANWESWRSREPPTVWPAQVERYRYSLILAFGVLYALATRYRAGRKLFWYDEIFTFYLSRLPDVSSLWSALKMGADFNPPLFYMITHYSQALFGEGHLGTRMPEIAGFGIFCLCLYRFVSSRTSVLAGLISMLFPMVTTAYFYSYDALGPAELWSGSCRR